MYGLSPVCVRRCAWRDFSRGNTRWHTSHLIEDLELDPDRISSDISSNLGRPRRFNAFELFCGVWYSKLLLMESLQSTRVGGEKKIGDDRSGDDDNGEWARLY